MATRITGAKQAGTRAQKELLRIADRQVRFAGFRALGDAVSETAFKMREMMPEYIDRPIPKTRKSILYERPKYQDFRGGSQIVASVYMANEGQGKGTLPPTKYMQYQVYGGARSVKGFEARLRRIGVLFPDEFVVPGAGLKLDRYGNIPGSVIVQVLSYFGAFGAYSGDIPNLAEERKKSLLPSGGKNLRGGKGRGKKVKPFLGKTSIRLFIGGRKGGSLKPGIYSATGRYGAIIKPLFVFVRQPLYRPRYLFHRLVEQLAPRYFRNAFRQRLPEAIATARSSANG